MMAAALPCMRQQLPLQLCMCAFLATVQPWAVMAHMPSKNCDWHSGQGVIYTKNPWTFAIEKDCTTLELPVRLWGPMDAQGAAALAEALKGVEHLKKLDLDYNQIGDEGAESIASALQHMPAMAALELKGNGISDKGIHALATEMWHVPQLTHLDLEKNKIGPSGARALAAALRKTPMMMYLSLGRNNIGKMGAKAIAMVLRHMPVLTGLDFYGNAIGDDGETLLAAAMARVEAGRGGQPWQYVTGISEEKLEKARKDHPTPTADVLEARHKDLAVLPMWQFVSQCGVQDEITDGVVLLLAALGIQELKDLSLWSDFEIERNLKRSNIHEDVRATLRKCIDEKVRNKEEPPVQIHSEASSEL